MTQTSAASKTSLMHGWDNPIGTDGFEFLEFAAQDITLLVNQFHALGFVEVAKHKSKNIFLYQQGEVRFIINDEKSGSSYQFAMQHGPCACAIAFRVHDANVAFKKLLALGAKPFTSSESSLDISVPAIYGIGDSVLYLIDDYAKGRQYLQDFKFHAAPEEKPAGFGVVYLDHVTHNVNRGHLDTWAGFYER